MITLLIKKIFNSIQSEINNFNKNKHKQTQNKYNKKY